MVLKNRNVYIKREESENALCVFVKFCLIFDETNRIAWKNAISSNILLYSDLCLFNSCYFQRNYDNILSIACIFCTHGEFFFSSRCFACSLSSRYKSKNTTYSLIKYRIWYCLYFFLFFFVNFHFFGLKIVKPMSRCFTSYKIIFKCFHYPAVLHYSLIIFALELGENE